MATKAERAAAREKYCTEKLTPILQVMVAEMLKVLPDDPDEYMRTWLDSKIQEEGGVPPTSPSLVFEAPVVAAAPPETRPSVGTPLEISGEILPEEEATRLSTLTQLIAETPGASRGTLLTVRGSVIPTNLTPDDEARMSTLSAVIADTPGAARGTVVTVRGTIKSKPGSIVTAQVVVPEEEAKRLSTLSQLINDTPGAARATTVTVRGTVSSQPVVLAATAVAAAPPPASVGAEVEITGEIVPGAEAARLSTLTQLMAETARGTLVTVRGSVAPTNLTPQEEARMSTLSAVIADTPGAARGTVVTVRGTVKSKPGSIVTAQVVVPEEEAKRLSTLSQLINDTPGAARATTVTVRGTVVTPAEASKLSTLSQVMADTPGAARVTAASVLSGLAAGPKGEPLQPLDKHEEERKTSQKRASNAASAEQLRVIAEMEHAAHDAKQERESNRKSALEAMAVQQEALVAEHGSAMRKVPSVPSEEQLQKKVSEVRSLKPLDKEEEERKSSQKRASNAASIEQLRVISEMEHAAHEAKQERDSNRKSALAAMTAEQESLVAERGTEVRKVPSVPNADELQKKVSSVRGTTAE